MDFLYSGMTSTFVHKSVSLLGFALISIIINRSIHAFNIDIENVKILKGSRGSQFGQTILFDKEHNRLLIGAPKETTNIKGANIKSGALHSCSLATTPVDCTRSSYYFPPSYSDTNAAKNEGYSSAISVSESGKVVVCAPHWKDTKYVKRNYTFVPGRCVVDLNLTQGDMKHVAPFYHRKNANLYLPKSKNYFHGLATFGLSTDSTGDSTFVFGVPGATTFEGGIYILDFEKHLRFSTTVPDTDEDTISTKTAYGYLGYQVKIGNFCDEGLCLAAGAPNLDIYGMVKLYKWLKSDDSLDNFQELQGEKVWSYFGSVLCAVDVDQDDIDELLVGAPFYSDSHSQSFDTGKVYVYKRKKMAKTFNLLLTLQGSGNKYSTFGSAIQSIGDINLDNYPDIAIGAPGEEDGSGCIYIYLGSPRGLHSKYSQRICANEIPGQGNSLKSFGSSISGSIKQPNITYPAFATSSYLTDRVIMFNSRVIVKPHVTIYANPNPIDLTHTCIVDHSMEPCTVLDVCYRQHMEGSNTSKLDFVVRIELDTQRRHGIQQRVQINDPVRGLQDSLVDRIVMGIDETGYCARFLVATKKDQVSKDQFTAIEIKVTMELNNTELQGKLNPILDPTVPNTFTHMVSLANDCGSDNVCDVDLTIDGTISFSHQKEYAYVVVGYTQEFEVELTISNVQEPSYGTKITVELSQPLQYLRLKSDTMKQCKSELLDTGVDMTVVVCNYYLPLRKDSSIKIGMVFDTTYVTLDQKNIKVSAKVISTDQIYSREKNVDNNVKQMKTSVYIVADVDTFGTSSPSEITITNARRLSLTVQEHITANFTQKDGESFDTVTLNHKYQMKNLGPSFLPKTRIYLSIPAYLPDASQLLTGVSVQLKSSDHDTVSCVGTVEKLIEHTTVIVPTSSTTISSQTGHSASITTKSERPKTTTQWTPDGTAHKRKKRTVDDDDHDDHQDHSKTYFLTCDLSPEYCITFRCDLPSNTPSRGHVTLNVTLSVDRGNIPIPEGFTSFYLELKAFVQQPKHLLFKPWGSKSEQRALSKTNTVFYIVQSGGEINIWIIIGSVIAGLLLILLIAIICWKLGFFKRKKHVEMEEWKRKSIKISRAPKT